MKTAMRTLALMLAVCLLLGALPLSAFAEEAMSLTQEPEVQPLALSPKPADGTTTEKPFVDGTGSGKFRIPGLVTLDGGRVIASADARWNHTGDGAGLDTIVSYSDDNGQNWHYTFANYLGDNGDTMNELSTSFIDPAIATDGKTAYMIADLFPAAIALNTSKYPPVAGKNGLDDQGRLLLRKNNLNVKNGGYNTDAANAAYDYYVEKGQIVGKDGTPVEGYTVDAYFNITGSGVSTNLFCADSPYQPYPTNYLYLTTSTDGQTWSAPELLNLKNPDEQTLLVGPGNGTFDPQTGRLIFTAYEHTNSFERTCLIWRDPQGTWHRTADATDSQRSSEATSVVLADGTVRCFFRGDENKLQYTDYTWNQQAGNYEPTARNQLFNVDRTVNNQMSAIKYSRLANGKELILLSTAASTNDNRINGHIYALSVEADNSMTLLHSYDVEPNIVEDYGYSCLTELQDGGIALLFEGYTFVMYYRTFPIGALTGNAELTTPQPPVPPEPPKPLDKTVTDEATGISVTAPGLESAQIGTVEPAPYGEYEVAAAYEITLNGGSYTGPAEVKIPAKDFENCHSFKGFTGDTEFEVNAPVDGYFTLQVPHFSVVTVYGTTRKEITLTAGETNTQYLNGLEYQLTNENITNSNPQAVEVAIQATPKTTGGYTEYTLGDPFKSDQITAMKADETITAVIASGANMLVSTQDGSNPPVVGFANATKVDKPGANALWTITKKGEFYQISQVIGSTTYYLYRSAANSTESGNTRTYTYELQLTENYKNVEEKGPNWRYDGGFYQNLTPGQENVGIIIDRWKDLTAVPFYLTPPGTAWAINNAKAAVELYTVTSTEIPSVTTYDHTITFTGKEAGQSDVRINGNLYQIKVENRQEKVALAINQEKSFPCSATSIPAQPAPAGIAEARLENGSLILKGLKEGTATMTLAGVDYTITVNGINDNPTIEETPFLAGTGIGHLDGGVTINGPVTKLTLSKGLAYDLNLRDTFAGTGTTVQWTVENPNIATVDPATGIVTGQAVGETRIKVIANGVGFSIPLVVKDFTPGADSLIYDFYASEITDTTVSYIWNNDSQLIPLTEGEAIYVNYPKGTASCCNFFGAPAPGYTLTRMSSTNSQGHYFLLHTGDHKTIDTTTTGFVNGEISGAKGAGVNQHTNWGSTEGSQLYNSVQAAIQAGCDGGMGFTRQTTGKDNVTCRLTFRSEKLPTVQKEVIGVLGGEGGNTYREYTPGMAAVAGETVYYRITVEKYASQDAIDYTNVILKDTLTAAVPTRLKLFKGDGKGNPVDPPLNNPSDITAEIKADGKNAGTHIYFASYVITKDDLGKDIINKADLSYNYKSAYSSGSFDSTANAEAKITAVQFRLKNMVADFGLPMTIHYPHANNVNLTPDTYQGTYGSAVVADAPGGGWDVTYTPTAVLCKEDQITVPGSIGGEAQDFPFYVFPASTVYYEEGFAALKGFTGGSKGTGTQEAQWVGETDKSNFGYDAAYAPETGMSGGHEATSNAPGSTAAFRFAGTGLDLYANCDPDTGALAVILKNAAGAIVKFYQVDTAMVNSAADTIGNQAVTAYGLPVVSLRDLPFDTYDVTVRHIAKTPGDTSPVRLDGFRVHNPLGNTLHPAYPKSEKNFFFAEIRDLLLTAMKFDPADSKSIYVQAGEALDQIYAGAGTADGAVVLGNGTSYTKKQMLELLDNGPKNELFLYPGQVLAMNLAANQVQLGLKAVDGAVTYELGGTGYSISSSTDLFYHPGLTGEVTLKNTSKDKILSVTLLKYFGEVAPTDLTEDLTETHMLRALAAAGYPLPEPPFPDVPVDAYFAGPVDWAVHNGITQGVSPTAFAPDRGCTRAQAVTFLWRAAQEPKAQNRDCPFLDVAPDAYYYEAVLWALENGIVRGLSEDTFGPEKLCTRAQIVTFLWRLRGTPAPTGSNPFGDVAADAYYADAVLWAVENRITQGLTSAAFGPDKTCTRAQIVTFLYRDTDPANPS